jgi:hypothetical protein
MRPFADGEAGDARVAMAGALLVRRRKTIDAQNARAALRKLVERSAAHGAEADNDDVVARQAGTAFQK